MDRSHSSLFSRTERKHLSPMEFNEIEFVARKPIFERHKGGIIATDGKKVYFFGIIDLFTFYG